MYILFTWGGSWGLKYVLRFFHEYPDADDSNGKASYKEDVKLEDKLALEAEEEKKVTSSDNYDDYSASEAAAGVDKSSVATAAGGAASVSAKDQASQEMQVWYSYPLYF